MLETRVEGDNTEIKIMKQESEIEIGSIDIDKYFNFC